MLKGEKTKVRERWEGGVLSTGIGVFCWGREEAAGVGI